MKKTPVLAILLMSLMACQPDEPEARSQRLFHFGTQIDLQIAGESEARSNELFTRADTLLGGWHKRWHAWEPSELTALNQALARGESVPVAPDLAALLKRSTALSAQTDELFNPAIGKRLKAWGFQRHDPNAPMSAATPIEAPVPSMSALTWTEGDSVTSSNPELSLDLGGIAKGYALNALLNDLRANGVRRAMVNLGGDIGVLGSLPERPWRIGILGGDGQAPIAALELYDGEMAFSSGVYARKHASGEGKTAHHIIDPRTGDPAEGNLATTVLGRDGELLQAASKVLLIAGADWRAYARRMALDYALVVRADGVIEVTSALNTRLERMAEDKDNWQVVP